MTSQDTSQYSSQYNVAILGATGLVGQHLIEILEQRDFPVAQLFPLASSRSAGGSVTFKGEKITVLDADSFDWSQAHIGLFSAGGSVSAIYAPKAADAGCVAAGAVAGALLRYGCSEYGKRRGNAGKADQEYVAQHGASLLLS